MSGPAECNTSTYNSRPANATGPIKVVLSKGFRNFLIQKLFSKDRIRVAIGKSILQSSAVI
jgi:hypothetical protein